MTIVLLCILLLLHLKYCGKWLSGDGWGKDDVGRGRLGMDSKFVGMDGDGDEVRPGADL